MATRKAVGDSGSFPDEPKATNSRIVEAVGTASGGEGGAGAHWSAAEIQDAMAGAAAKAAEEGISDPDEVRDRMLAARKALKEERRAEAQRLADEAKRMEDGDTTAKKGRKG